jgi:hypothetical protein
MMQLHQMTSYLLFWPDLKIKCYFKFLANDIKHFGLLIIIIINFLQSFSESTEFYKKPLYLGF